MKTTLSELKELIREAVTALVPVKIGWLTANIAGEIQRNWTSVVG